MDLNRLLGRVMGSDLVLSVCDTSAGSSQSALGKPVDIYHSLHAQQVRKSNGFWPDIAIMAGFLDLTRLLGRVMGSDLVLSVCNTCAGQ